MARPAVPLVVALLLGVWIGDAAGVSALAPGLVPAALMLAVAALGGSLIAARSRPAVATLVVGLGFVGVGVAAGAITRGQRITPLEQWYEATRADVGSGFVADLEGTFQRDAMPTVYGATVLVDVTRVGTSGSMRATRGTVRLAVGGAFVEPRLADWRAGRPVRLSARLRQPARYANAGRPDQAEALKRREVSLLGSVTSALLVTVVRPGAAPSEWAGRGRDAIRRAVARTVARFSERSAGIVTAVLIGDRAGLDHDTTDRLQRAGTYHVIAISGGNIAVLAGALLLLVRVGGGGARLAAVTTMVGLVVYGQVVAPEASVARAVAAAVVLLGARVVDHHTDPLNTLAVVAGGLVAVAPGFIFDPGFHLTFGATAGIVVGVPRLVGARPRTLPGRLYLGVAGILAATVCAELALLPIGATLFSRITAAGLILNMVAVPLMAVTQLAGMTAVALSLCGVPGAAGMGWLAHAAAYGIVESTALVEWLPGLVRRVPAPPVAVAVLYYIGWIGALAATGSPPLRRVAQGVVAVCAAVIVVGPTAIPEWRHVPAACRGALRVHFLDVDQGDATLVRFPNGASMLVDAGGSLSGRFDVGARVVVPAVWALGVSRLDVLVLSHADPDHVGGAPAVVADLAPREVWEGIPVVASARRAAVAAVAVGRGADWRAVTTGDETLVGDVHVRVAHPPPATWERPRVPNDDSVVLELRLGDVSIVLAGDIERDAERAMLAHAWPPARWRVVKVPHHGSRSSSTGAFVDRLRPTVAVVSAGRESRFGHPHPEVVGRYEAAGAVVLTTGTDGAIHVCTDGDRLTVSSVRGQPITF